MKQNILITGSTDGIGKLAAIKFAEAGHRVLIHGRSVKKLEANLQEIKTLVPSASIEGILGDLSEFDQVDDMVSNIKQKTDSLDILVNNAGVYNSSMTFNSKGIDLRFQVNFLAPIYLTRCLWPLLTKNAHIINLSSAAQETVDLEALVGKKELSNQRAYAQSKLALTMWTFDLDRKMEEITVTPVNPGSLLNTKMVKEAFGRHWAPADKGANILFKLATDPSFRRTPSEYFDNDQGNPIGSYSKAHSDAYDSLKIQELMGITNSIIPKI